MRHSGCTRAPLGSHFSPPGAEAQNQPPNLKKDLFQAPFGPVNPSIPTYASATQICSKPNSASFCANDLIYVNWCSFEEGNIAVRPTTTTPSLPYTLLRYRYCPPPIPIFFHHFPPTATRLHTFVDVLHSCKPTPFCPAPSYLQIFRPAAPAIQAAFPTFHLAVFSLNSGIVAASLVAYAGRLLSALLLLTSSFRNHPSNNCSCRHSSGETARE